ncbi:MAG: hypothetical protein E7451_09705 [Ruminococcaceae bacterium]|nr:hypothetical protein [Oscillospiraceae bacterium]
MIIIYIFEIPVVVLVMIMILIGGIEPGEICRMAGGICGGGGALVALWLLLGGYPVVYKTKENKAWGIRLFLIAAMVLLFVIPGWEVYKVGVGMGDSRLAELLLR